MGLAAVTLRGRHGKRRTAGKEEPAGNCPSPPAAGLASLGLETISGGAARTGDNR